MAIILGIVLFDQLTKIAAQNILPTMPGGTYAVFPGFASFTYVQNTGAAFSIFSGATAVLGVVSLVLAGVLCWFLIKTAKYRSILLMLALTFLIGGAVGNVIDRFMLDMIQFTFVNFAVFNVADSFACIGAVLLGVFLLFKWDRIKARQAQKE